MKHSKIAVLLAAMLLAGFSAEAQNFLFTDTSATGQVLYYDTLNGAARVVCPTGVYGNYNGYTAPGDTVVIPDWVVWNGQSLPVLYVRDGAFRGCHQVTTLVCGTNLVEIGQRAFRNTGLTSITFNSGLLTIGSMAFGGIPVREITVPSGVESIGNAAFSGLLNVVYNGTADGAPWGAKGVNMYLSDSIYYRTAAMDTVVVALPGLTEAVLPSSVVCIGSLAFNLQHSLRRVVLPSGLKSLMSMCFQNCTALDSIVLPDSLEFIGNYAFSGCTALTSIYIPNNVRMETSLFSSCFSLTDVHLPDTLTSIGSHMFENCSSLARINFPPTLKSVGYHAFEDCTALDSVMLPEGFTTIGTSSFHGCTALHTIGLPSTLTTIGTSAFNACTSLTELTIPDSVTTIGVGAFLYCTSLHRVTIGRGMQSIGWDAFDGCSALDTLLWNADSCGFLGEPHYQGSWIAGVQYHPFDDCPALQTLIVGDSVRCLPNYFFNPVTTLLRLVLGASLNEVGYSAFDNSTLLDTITCRSLVPPHSGAVYAFWHLAVDSVMVEVPCAAIGDYIASPSWSDFPHIASYDVSLSLTLSVNNEALGSVHSLGIGCDSTVTVVATPADGAFLLGWSDGGAGTTRTLHLTGDSSLVAIFAIADTFNITLTSTASAICTGGGIYLTGDTAVLSVMPPVYYRFDGWSDGDTTNPRRVCVMSDSAFTAIVTPVAVPHDTLYIIDTLVVEQYDTLTIHTDTTITVEQWEDVYIHDTIYIDSVITVEIHITDSLTPWCAVGSADNPSPSGERSEAGAKTTISYTTAAGHALQFTINADGVSVTATQLYPGTAGQYDTLYVPDTVMHGGNAYAVTRIGYHAFYGLIRYVVLPPTVRVIADQAFYYGERMRYLGLNEGLDTIGTNAFYHCSVLDSIILPNSVRYIGSNAFQACFAMRKAVLPQGFKVINASTFYDCEQLHSVDFGDSLEVIGDYAFGDTHIDTITLPATVQSIGYHAFYYEWPTYPTQMVRLLGTVPPTLAYEHSGLLSSVQVRVPCEAIADYWNDPSWSFFPNLRSYGIDIEPIMIANYGGSVRLVQPADCDSIAVIAAIANNGYRFVGWSDGSTDNPRTVQLPGDSIFRAQFILFRPQIDVDIQGNGTVLGAGEYALNASVTLSALPAYGSYFLGWSGLTDSILIDNPLVFTANDDYSIMAHFGSGTPAPIYDVAVYLTDTILLAITDTLIVVDTTYDTIVDQNLIHDTTYIVNVIYDTVYIHDTVYVEPPVGLDDVVLDDVVLRNENGNIIVSSSREHTVVLYDVSGRRLAIGRGCSLSFGIPCSGVYLLRIDALPARRIMAIR